MIIRLKLYAFLSELLPAHAQRNAAEVHIADDATLNDVIQQFHIPPESAHLVLLNGTFICDMDRNVVGIIKAGDTLAIWPPVAGG